MSAKFVQYRAGLEPFDLISGEATVERDLFDAAMTAEDLIRQAALAPTFSDGLRQAEEVLSAIFAQQDLLTALTGGRRG